MIRLTYDLHIHSCLSPCGDNDMTPGNIIGMGSVCELDIMALTDHNSCKNCEAAAAHATEAGIIFLPGMELCTMEEAHVVCLFPRLSSALSFDEYVYKKLLPIPANDKAFGEQLIMNEHDEIVGREPTLLVMASDISVSGISALVKSFGGACFAAHVDKKAYSVISNLGDIPEDAGFTAAEISKNGDLQDMLLRYPRLAPLKIMRDSDAHYLEHIGTADGVMHLPERSPEAVISYINGEV